MAEPTKVLEKKFIPLQKSPLDKERNDTENFFKFLFAFLACFWVFANIVVLFCKTKREINFNEKLVFNKDGEYNSTSAPYRAFYYTLFLIDKSTDIACVLYEYKVRLLMYSIVAGQVFLYAIFFLVKYKTKFFTYLGLVGTVIVLSVWLYDTITNVVNPKKSGWLVGLEITCTIVKFASAVVTIYYALKLKEAPITNIIGKGLSSLYHFISMIAFIVFTALFFILLIIVTFASLHRLQHFSATRYFILFGAVFIFFFMGSMVNMIVSVMVASLHWRSNATQWLKSPVMRCFTNVARFHMGSAVLSTTYVLPFSMGLIVLYRHGLFKNYKNPVAIITMTIYLMFNISWYAEILVAVNGYNYFEAVKQAYRILLRNSPKSLTTIQIFNAITTVILFLTFTTITIIFILIFQHYIRFVVPLELLFARYAIESILSLSVLSGVLAFAMIPLFSSVNTSVICHVIDEDDTLLREDSDFDSIQVDTLSAI